MRRLSDGHFGKWNSHHIAASTVANILKAEGIEPAPQRQRLTTWTTFIKSHWDVLAAIDFTTVEVWTHKGLVTIYLLFAMHQATRRVHWYNVVGSPDAGKPVSVQFRWPAAALLGKRN